MCKMPKILILVLSAQRQPWNAMLRKQRDTWDSIGNDATETIFYIGGNNQARFDDRTFFSQTDEHLENIGRRTVEALEFALTRQWDFMARVHSSTYVHKRKLVEFIETAPKTGAMLGSVTDHEGLPYCWGGGHMVYSRDIIELLVKNKEAWDHNRMEDVAISRLALSLGIKFGACPSTSIDWANDLQKVQCTTYGGKIGGFEFTDFKELNRLTDQYQFRCKFDPDRSVDLRTMDSLFQNLAP